MGRWFLATGGARDVLDEMPLLGLTARCYSIHGHWPRRVQWNALANVHLITSSVVSESGTQNFSGRVAQRTDTRHGMIYLLS